MQVFARREFHLRAASLETRIAYAGFLLLMVPAIATFVALSIGRIGISPHSIATYYRGGESEMAFPKTFWQLMEISHFHLFSMPVVVLILSHLLFATSASRKVRIALTIMTYSGALLDVLMPWAVRYVSGAFAYGQILGWVLLAGGFGAIVAVTLVSMWGPARVSSEPEPLTESKE